MMLPKAHLTLVEREKITEYLLNPEHPDNGGKAVFFMALGFTLEGWEMFADALRKLALTASVSRSMETVHGKKYMLMEKSRLLYAKQFRCELSGSLMQERIYRDW